MVMVISIYISLNDCRPAMAAILSLNRKIKMTQITQYEYREEFSARKYYIGSMLPRTENLSLYCFH